jgi:HD superfamily phosphohydrolase
LAPGLVEVVGAVDASPTARRGLAKLSDKPTTYTYANVLDGLSDRDKIIFKAYVDISNKDTYLNYSGCARKAGYRAKDRSTLYRLGRNRVEKMKDRINWYLKTECLDEGRFHAKLFELLDAKVTHLKRVKGEVQEVDLSPNVQVLVKAEQTKIAQTGERYQEENSVVGISMADRHLQRKALDMVAKILGRYAPEKHELGETFAALVNRLNAANARVSMGDSDG